MVLAARAGTKRALAVTGARRAPALPEVPTFAEAGLPGVDASTLWHALAPAGTPEGLRRRLAEGFAAGLHHAEAAPRLRDLGFEPIGAGPAEHAAALAAETAK